VSYLPRPESEPPELLETPVRFVTSPRFDKAPMSVSVVGLDERDEDHKLNEPGIPAKPKPTT
jgi:hypothetical protein